MARKPTPQPLTLVEGATGRSEPRSFFDSPKSPALSVKSPKSPRSPFKFSSSKKSLIQGEQPSMHTAEPLRNLTNLPTLPTIPPLPLQQQFGEDGAQDRQEDRPARSGFFSNYKASKSSSRLQPSANPKHVEEDNMSRDRPGNTRKGSSQEISRTEPTENKTGKRKPVPGPATSDGSLDTSQEATPTSLGANVIRKNKPKPFSILGRTRSIRGDELSPRASDEEHKIQEPERPYNQDPLIRTAPLRSDTDRSFREIMNSSVRQRSVDRQPTTVRNGSHGRESARNQSSLSLPFREAGGNGFLNNLKSSATKGAGAIGKSLFGKSGRSFSSHEKEQPVDDEHYELKIINKPLVEQTRLTRISKRLENSRDKTEFWMPAFPWRAIDYLNYKGSDVEGLYRVPGSGPQIKKWQRRFDEELDIDLFEQDDLYDINIIGSMLKAWLRELPDEIFPKSSQERIARECAGAETVPQMLIDELSKLPPFNYYLLFAITCHLSLLLAHSEKNKMDFRNLCICFQPCMKIDAFCFKFLVCDWRDCWKGCKTEVAYKEQEYLLFETVPPSSAEGRSSTAVESHDERNVSSSDSSKPPSMNVEKESGGQKLGRQDRHQHQHQEKNVKKRLPNSQSDGSLSTISTSLTVVQERTPPRKGADMRPLSPIKPLSPIGL